MKGTWEYKKEETLLFLLSHLIRNYGHSKSTPLRGISGDSLVDGKKTGITARKGCKFRHGHAAVQCFPVCQGNVKIMCICDDGDNLIKEYPHRFSVADHLYIFLHRREHFQNVRENLKDPLRGERLGDMTLLLLCLWDMIDICRVCG